MVSSLDEAYKLQKQMRDVAQERGHAPYRVDIIREVRWYANIDGKDYMLPRDWTTEVVDQKLLEHAMEKGNE